MLRQTKADPSGRCEWRHMCAHNPSTRTWLGEVLNLDDNVVDAMLADGTRPRILRRKEGIMLNLRGINTTNPEEPEDMISLRIWISGHRIVTVRRRDLLAVEEVMKQITQGVGPSTVGEFLTAITTQMFDRMAPYIEQLEQCVEQLEQAFESGSDDDVIEDAVPVRRRGTIYRRHIKPQADILESLRSSRLTWLDERDREELSESHDQLIRYTELLEDFRERTQILNEEIRSHQADRLNQMAYLFSVAATIFLPLSFLTGLMGINAGGIPGAENVYGFWIFLVLCVILVAGQIVFFRRKRWF